MNKSPLSQALVRTGNRIMTARILNMSTPPYQEGKGVYRIVETRGRKTGQIRRAPLAIYQYHDQRYLIAPSRGRDWVYNLIAHGTCTLLAKTEREQVHVTLTFDDEAIGAVQAYMAQLPNWTAQQFPFPATASVEEMRDKTEKFAIFRLL